MSTSAARRNLINRGKKMKHIKDIDCTQKKVFLRTDFNVPMDEQSNITDDSRIKRALPTIKYLIDKNSAIIIASHLGRPKGCYNAQLSLKPAAKRLSDILGKKVTFCDDFTNSEGKKLIDNIKPGEILFLENLRFYSSEEKNDPDILLHIESKRGFATGDFRDHRRVHGFICAHRLQIEDLSAKRRRFGRYCRLFKRICNAVIGRNGKNSSKRRGFP